MLNINLNYPYPVLREYAEDYVNTVFTGELAVRLEPDGYVIYPKFEIGNESIEKMIEDDELTYAIEVQCVSTWFRKLYKVKKNEPIKLNPEKIHERVELIPCIIAASSIKGYTNNDFAEEYLNMSFELNPGEIVGIGERRVFDALYQNDIIKNGSSIVSISGNNSIKEVTCNFNNSTIEIMLPMKQYSDYLECGYNKTKYKMLNAIYTIPVLVEAITIIAADENDPNANREYENKAWYKTIVVNLKRLAENDEAKYRNLLGKPFSSAEILLGNNSAAAVKYLNDLE